MAVAAQLRVSEPSRVRGTAGGGDGSLTSGVRAQTRGEKNLCN